MNGIATATKVKLLGKSQVKPRKVIGRKACQLVMFDLPYLAFYYNQKLLFYKVEDGGFEGIVAKLKDGLGAVLEDFYQLAGKLGKDEEGVFRVEYDDDPVEGVEVIDASADGVSVDDLESKEGTETFRDFIPYNGILNLEGLHRPLVSVQLTKLKDGIAMGCAFKHADQVPGQRNPPPDATKPFSTFQSLSAHIWRHVTQARCLRPEDVTVFADCRNRVDHPMAKSYFGNLIQAIFTGTAAGLILLHPPSFGAALIQKAIASHDAAMIDERNKQWEAAPKIGRRGELCERKPDGWQKKSFSFLCTISPNPLFSVAALVTQGCVSPAASEGSRQWIPGGFSSLANCVEVGSSPRFKMYEVDFGWGKPEGVRSGSNNRLRRDGLCWTIGEDAAGFDGAGVSAHATEVETSHTWKPIQQ
ncbi:hypothetical protein MLD38_033532 [Melastoma candidum]|uniref:Uncharacterized protein n=1 Tax=Melastoma candidum TaxID=119954 RepID=A0ACB9M9Q5_9MYRT|nr:hypothetical protein MLD38_033532 [Melastoma candidum]